MEPIKKSLCCNARIELRGRYGGKQEFQYCSKCDRRQDLLPKFIQTMRVELPNIGRPYTKNDVRIVQDLENGVVLINILKDLA